MRALLLILLLGLSLSAVEADPFAAPPEVQQFARRITGVHVGTWAKLNALLAAIFRSPREEGLGVTYDNERTRTVEEVWRERKANCLSLTAFYVAACRSLGIEVYFADSLGISRWRRVGSIIRYERHVVALIPMIPMGDLVADFAPELRRGNHLVNPISEQRMRALFHSNRAVEAFQVGQSEEALREAKASIQVDPDSGVGWNVLGVIQRFFQNPLEAERCFRKALAVDPKDGVSCGNMEALLRNQGRMEEAERFRELGLELRKKDPYFNAFLAEEALQTGQYLEAHKRIKQAIKLLPQEPDFYTLLARLSLEQGQTQDAIKALEKAKRWCNPEERERFESKLVKLRST